MLTLKSATMRVTVCAAAMLALCITIPIAWHPANALAAALQGPASKPAQKVRIKTAPPTVNPVANPTPSATAELTAADLEAFLGGLMPVEIQRADIAGAVVAVVKDGKLLFAKGYGYADVAKKTPISPETTLFRPGSISKTFTWTAVMQLVEQGKLNLDADVNQYLDFKIPPAFGKPITLRDIMTHRSGYEETVKDLFVGSAKELQPMGRYLPAHMPARIFPPGEVPAYSNYAADVAGYIVQRVSGQSYEDYIEEHIFKPLQMEYATFQQPLPPNLQPFMSSGYILASRGARPFEYVQVAPAGALSASAIAMSHFMIAHLQNGRYGDTQILRPETAKEMHARQSGWPASMNAMALGFYEESRNGHRIIGHGGDTECFHSDLHLILDANVGVFVSYNSLGRAEVSAREVLFEKFMDRYFPYEAPNSASPSTAAADAQSVVGSYASSRRFQSNILAVTEMIGQLNISADKKDNTIYSDALKGLNGQPTHYREIGPLLFRSVDGQSKLQFEKDATGRRIIYIDYPFMIFQQVNSPLGKQGVNYLILGLSLGVIVLTLLLWPVGAIIRKHYGRPLMLDVGARRLRMWMHVVCIIDVIFVGGMLALVSALSNITALTDNLDKWIHLLQVIGVLAGIGALAGIYTAVKSWGDARQWMWYKVWNTLLAIGCVGFFWFIFHWHLLNFHLNY